MGADLISYISVGPETITVDDSDLERLVQKAKTVQERVQEHADRLIVDGETNLAENPLPQNEADQSVSIPIAFDGGDEKIEKIDSLEEIKQAENTIQLRRRALTFSGLGNYGDVLGRNKEAIVETIEEFVDTWNREIPWRNIASRPMPGDEDRKIVVAGERTMGDEPGGAFKVLKTAFAMGVAQELGCT
jgi:hypothetical protein